MSIFERRGALRRAKKVLKPPTKKQIDRTVDWRPRVRIAPKRQPRQSGPLVMRLRSVRRFQALAESIGPAASDAFERHFMPFARTVVERWPVETGLSRAAFRVRPRRTRTKLRVRLQNDVFYSQFVDVDGLVFRPADAMAKRVGARLAANLAERR